MDATVEVEALRYLYLETKSNKASSIKINQNNELKILVLGEFNGDTTMELLLATTSIDVSGFNVTFTLKPHPVCPMGFEKFDVINIPVTFEPIDKIVNDFDVAIVARTTSAAMDVYYSGLKVIVFLGKKEINLSPLRNVADVQFVRTATELSDVICNLNTNLLQDQPDNSYDEEYFYLDNNLSRWKSLISSVEEGIS